MLAVLLVAVRMAASAPVPPSHADAPSRPLVVALGDSITYADDTFAAMHLKEKAR